MFLFLIGLIFYLFVLKDKDPELLIMFCTFCVLMSLMKEKEG